MNPMRHAFPKLIICGHCILKAMGNKSVKAQIIMFTDILYTFPIMMVMGNLILLTHLQHTVLQNHEWPLLSQAFLPCLIRGTFNSCFS